MEKQSYLLKQCLAEADSVISRSYLLDICNKDIIPSELSLADCYNLRLLKLKMLVYNPEENINDKLMTIYSALLDAVENVNVGLIVRSYASGEVDFIFAIYAADETGSAAKLLQGGILGNFPGSELKNYSRDEICGCMNDIFGNGSKEIACLNVLPANRDANKEQFVQGIEKFIDSMRGKNFTALFISEGIKREIAEIRKNGFEMMYSALVPFSKISLAYGINESQSVANSITLSTNESLAKGTSRAVTDGWSYSESDSYGKSSSYRTDGTGDGWTWGENESHTTTQGINHSVSNTQSQTVTTGSSRSDGRTETSSAGSSFTKTIENQNKTVLDMMAQIERNIARIGDSETYGLWNCACYFIADDIQTLSLASNTYKALVTGQGTGEEEAHINIWSTISEHQNQREKLQELLYYILNLRHPRFSFSKRERDYKTTGCLVSGKDLPLLLGVPRKTIPGLIVYSIAEFGRNIFTKNLIAKNPRKRASFPLGVYDKEKSILNFLAEKYSYRSKSEWDTAIKGKQITLFHNGNPEICEDPNRILQEGDFIQFADIWEFKVGDVFHMGNIENTDVTLDMDSFTSHCFIAGSTGSGKSNTTCHLLENFIAHNIPFLVIEPAKGEYKKDFGKLPGVKIYTTNQQYNQLLRINPFRFHLNIHVLEHLDRLLEIFNVCWEMTPAVQAFLKNAIERSYIQAGWDLANSISLSPTVTFPTLKDLLDVIPKLISESQYSDTLKKDIEGALTTRIKTLTSGIFGQIFCSELDINDEILFNRNVIVDLSRVGSSESKALIMGLLVTRLTEYRSATAKETNQGIRHITILEEAHNLLKNTNGNASKLASKSVEMICNGIAEMRTYGEGFIIVDQSPTAVDIAAIKNTNTKIIMRLPDKTDCEISGNAFGLNEYQMAEIPKLPQGVAIVMQSNWIKPVLTKISKAYDSFSLSAIEQTSMNEIVEFKSLIVNEIFMQATLKLKKFDKDRFINLLNKKNIKSCLHSEFEEFVFPQLSSLEASLPISAPLKKFLFDFINCRGIFLHTLNLAKQVINASDEDAKTIADYWQKKVIAILKNYVAIRPAFQKRLFDCLCIACNGEDISITVDAWKKQRDINEGK